MNNYNINFIKQKDFEQHVENTIKQYNKTLKSINLNKFNNNLIDPIKLIFDKNVFNKNFKDIIEFEISRQRDKSNNNIIGYFHQNIFKYIDNCKVPKNGWDIIFSKNNVSYYVEMKNKHNTMNSSSSAKTYMKMQNHLLNSKDKENSICALVEIIAKKSQNIPWIISIDSLKQKSNDNLRRISIDKFYEIVTGEKDAFKQICYQLPITIENIVKNNRHLQVEKDTVFDELKNINDNVLISLYKITFSTYNGFDF